MRNGSTKGLRWAKFFTRWMCRSVSRVPAESTTMPSRVVMSASRIMPDPSVVSVACCGVTLIVGGHSHQAADSIAPLRGGAAQTVFSLGNFIFDQSAPRGSGAFLELRVFKQGTLAARLVPMPNLFDLTRPAPP